MSILQPGEYLEFSIFLAESGKIRKSKRVKSEKGIETRTDFPVSILHGLLSGVQITQDLIQNSVISKI